MLAHRIRYHCDGQVKVKSVCVCVCVCMCVCVCVCVCVHIDLCANKYCGTALSKHRPLGLKWGRSNFEGRASTSVCHFAYNPIIPTQDA